MRISDWSSDVCSSDLGAGGAHQAVMGACGQGRVVDQHRGTIAGRDLQFHLRAVGGGDVLGHVGKADKHLIAHVWFEGADGAFQLHAIGDDVVADAAVDRSEEHTSELQSLMRISYAVFCLKKKN